MADNVQFQLLTASMPKKRSFSKVHKKELETVDDDDQSNSGHILKRKQSRKEARKEFRARKKARIHAHFSNKKGKDQLATDVNKKQSEETGSGGQYVENSKKKKKKRKTKLDDQERVPAVGSSLSTKMYENEDQEIKELEKKLRLNKKARLPEAFVEEGLSDIIDMCNAIESGSLKPEVASTEDDEDGDIDNGGEIELVAEDESDGYMDDSEDDNYVEQGVVEDTASNTDSDMEDDTGKQPDDEDRSEGESEPSGEDENSADEDAYDNEDEEDLPKFRKSSSDIYGGATAKYVPPHHRQRDNRIGKREVDERLRKQVKGLLNRLSESNLSVVSGKIEELYMSNSRNDLNDVLSQLLMDACVSTSLMPEGLLREHVMLIAVLNSRIGSEVGAFVLQKLAVEFDKQHSAQDNKSESKEIHNIVTLFAFLYSFKVIDCIFIYDVIRRLVAPFQEQDVELILLLIRLVGVEIRRESPESLKEIILEVQAKAATSTELNNTSRTRFMLETINALRNNNMRKIPNYDPSPIDRARKILKSVANDSGQNEYAKLSISLSDLLSADQKGRWWIVGSAWSEREKNNSSTFDIPEMTDHANILEIARQQRMNTDVRRNIFCTVMTSEDYIDSFEKLMRLKLKSKQCREIIHVLMDCSLQEKSYNPFYSYLIQKFCEFSRSYQVTVQYSLWDRFKMAPTLSDKNLSNMAHLLVHLLVNKSLSLSVLKVVDFTTLDKKLVNFFTEMLTHILLDYQESTIREVFTRIAPLTKLDALKESLKLFMKHFLKSKRSKSSRELSTKHRTGDKKEKLQERITLAIDALTGS